MLWLTNQKYSKVLCNKKGDEINVVSLWFDLFIQHFLAQRTVLYVHLSS